VLFVVKRLHHLIRSVYDTWLDLEYCSKMGLVKFSSKINKTLVLCFLPGNSPASVFYMPTFRNTLVNIHGRLMKMVQSVPKPWHIKFKRWGITQKKSYAIQNFILIFRASWLYKDRTSCNSMQVFIYCKITLHVSGVYRTHHQEYIKL